MTNDDLLARAKQVARVISRRERMRINQRQFEEAGIEMEDIKTIADSIGSDVEDLLLVGTSSAIHHPGQAVPVIQSHVVVDIADEAITLRGKTFDIDQQMAAVVQCLLDSNGERRSQSDMRRTYPKHIVDERLDTTIRRKLKRHKSGIGEYINSDTRGFWIDIERLCR
ncbi:hypothetical protein [Fuerstiella marisgermanici]|uniref:Uncharacterized protein n=1 Tax=Fuerstiella marisgermanici TaxID=1891926 RepID=A0A1P8WGX6_9PLAN|nr:hypothetical protein [Fuerstiella marisgermanici]APZ93285.1 hypothetical protein Fuma_02902 [Fuerstiella marisgermanici]